MYFLNSPEIIQPGQRPVPTPATLATTLPSPAEGTGQGSLSSGLSECWAFALAKGDCSADRWSFSSWTDCLIPGRQKWECHFSATTLGPEIISVEFLSWDIWQVVCN